MSKAIRNSTASILSTALTGVTVYNSKVTPQMVTNLPSVAVYVESLDGSKAANNVKAMLETVTLQIVVLVTGESTWADSADNIVQSILQSLFTSSTWTANFNSVSGYSINYDHGSNGQKPIGSAQISIRGTVLRKF